MGEPICPANENPARAKPTIEICATRQQLLDCRGHAVVTGGPGSGKTTIALKKAVTRLQEGLTPGQSILFLSFSRAAIARIGEALKIEVSRDQRGALNVQTFHSFFWELLRSHAYLLGAPTRLRVLLPHDERALSQGIKEDDLLWPTWIAERERLWREEGRIAFDLFAPLAARLIENSRHLRRMTSQRYPLIIVDEAQDTGPDAWHCIKLLAEQTQIICLADLEQQIFDHLPGIGPERLEAIQAALSPLIIDLASQNHRSPGSEILTFARDVLSGKRTKEQYAGVSRISYNPKTHDWLQTLRKALGILQHEIRKTTGNWAETIAILVPFGSSAARFSVAMNSGVKPIKHRLLFDETEVMLAARFTAFLLEPRGDEPVDLAEALELLADIKRANGSTEWQRFHGWASKVLSGKKPKAGLVSALQTLLQEFRSVSLTGDPARDWTFVKKALRASGNPELAKIANHLDYLVAFNRGKRISANLSESWQRDGQYTKAREALELALVQDQMIDDLDDALGIQLMTIHKAKSKQFDGVIVVREGRHDGQQFVSNFVWRDDNPPYWRSRKILHVAVTRARVHTLILDPLWPGCPIVDPVLNFRPRSLSARTSPVI